MTAFGSCRSPIRSKKRLADYRKNQGKQYLGLCSKKECIFPNSQLVLHKWVDHVYYGCDQWNVFIKNNKPWVSTNVNGNLFTRHACHTFSRCANNFKLGEISVISRSNITNLSGIIVVCIWSQDFVSFVLTILIFKLSKDFICRRDNVTIGVQLKHRIYLLIWTFRSIVSAN